MFLSFEGVDGCGKSTQSKRIANRLENHGFLVERCRDPGTTPLGNAVREVLLHHNEMKITPMSELFLFMAARSQMVEEVIRPAITRGKIVVCDRFLLSSIVYQGYAGGISVPIIESIGKLATAALLPDLTFVLDVPYEIGTKRMRNRSGPDRMESKGEAYHRSVREGFLKHAQTDPGKYVLIDASQSTDEIEFEIWAVLERYLKKPAV